MIRSKNFENVWEVVQNAETDLVEFDKQISAPFYTLTSTSHFFTKKFYT